MTAGLRRYSVGQREQALGLLEAGMSGLQVARQVGVDRFAVARWAKVAGMRMRMGPVGGLVGGPVGGPVGGQVGVRSVGWSARRWRRQYTATSPTLGAG